MLLLINIYIALQEVINYHIELVNSSFGKLDVGVRLSYAQTKLDTQNLR